jgi:glycosyltransferase involved in cell wall biosynthesis
MPCRNAGPTVAAAIQSVQDQTLQDWELLVADDGSSDDSAAIIRERAKQDPRVIPLESPANKTGAAAARNYALNQAKGRFIAFLDADDLWLPSKLERQLNFMQTHGTVFSYTSYYLRRTARADYIRVAPKMLTRKMLLWGNRIGCLTAVYDTKHLGKQPMPDIPKRHDYALWLHLLTLTPTAAALAEPLAIHHRQKGSLSSNSWHSTLATCRMLHAQAGLSRPAAIQATLRHVARRMLHG